jgi:hypothetical protein
MLVRDQALSGMVCRDECVALFNSAIGPKYLLPDLSRRLGHLQPIDLSTLSASDRLATIRGSSNRCPKNRVKRGINILTRP